MALAHPTDRVTWLLEAPAAALSRQSFERQGPAFAATILVASAFTMALAETIVQNGSARQLAFNVASLSIGFFLTAGLFYELSRVMGSGASDWRDWLVAGSFALAPFLLTLPIALIAKGLGGGGLVVYELGKLAVLAAVAGRWLMAIRTLNGWPSWAASLLFIAPAFLALLGLGLLFMGLAGSVLLLLLAGLAA